MELGIKNRLVLINGPSCSGKTTLAHSIAEEYNGVGKCAIISHDEVLSLVNKNQPQEKINEDFRYLFLDAICAAFVLPDIDVIVLDTFNVEIKRLLAFINVIRSVCKYEDPITWIKMNVDENLHNQFMFRRFCNPYTIEAIKSQVWKYKGIEGSLNKTIPLCDTTIIKDPRKVNITFDLPSQALWSAEKEDKKKLFFNL